MSLNVEMPFWITQYFTMGVQAGLVYINFKGSSKESSYEVDDDVLAYCAGLSLNKDFSFNEKNFDIVYKLEAIQDSDRLFFTN
jgi:hypothetical protein